MIFLISRIIIGFIEYEFLQKKRLRQKVSFFSFINPFIDNKVFFGFMALELLAEVLIFLTVLQFI